MFSCQTVPCRRQAIGKSPQAQAVVVQPDADPNLWVGSHLAGYEGLTAGSTLSRESHSGIRQAGDLSALDTDSPPSLAKGTPGIG